MQEFFFFFFFFFLQLDLLHFISGFRNKVEIKRHDWHSKQPVNGVVWKCDPVIIEKS